MGPFLRLWAPVVIWMGATFVVSHQPKVTIPFDAPDYLAHGLSYALFGLLLVRAFARGRWTAVTPAMAMLATLLGAVYGLSDEFHQSFIPGRHASASDLVADIVGTATGAFGAAWAAHRAPRT